MKSKGKILVLLKYIILQEKPWQRGNSNPRTGAGGLLVLVLQEARIESPWSWDSDIWKLSLFNFFLLLSIFQLLPLREQNEANSRRVGKKN